LFPYYLSSDYLFPYYLLPTTCSLPPTTYHLLPTTCAAAALNPPVAVALPPLPQPWLLSQLLAALLE